MTKSETWDAAMGAFKRINALPDVAAQRIAFIQTILAAEQRGAEKEREAWNLEIAKWKRRDHLSLHAGEVTDQEFRTVIAVLNTIAAISSGRKIQRASSDEIVREMRSSEWRY